MRFYPHGVWFLILWSTAAMLSTLCLAWHVLTSPRFWVYGWMSQSSATCWKSFGWRSSFGWELMVATLCCLLHAGRNSLG
ncbi:hypothetical protein NC653_002166 [Populus alba x Populus x berolinensis]|nr:hypothetical protein NC653_002166 [Populus alba x Populus x berolinensis]